jgi:hypothetical protein
MAVFGSLAAARFAAAVLADFLVRPPSFTAVVLPDFAELRFSAAFLLVVDFRRAGVARVFLDLLRLAGLRTAFFFTTIKVLLLFPWQK